MRKCGQQVSDAEQAAQGVVGELGLTAHIPLDPQCRVEAEDAGSGGAAEILQAALVQPQAQIVVGLVGVNAPVALGQILLQASALMYCSTRSLSVFHWPNLPMPMWTMPNRQLNASTPASRRRAKTLRCCQRLQMQW